MSEVTYLHKLTTMGVPPSRVAQGALDADLKQVVVIGEEEDGSLYLASSSGNNAENLWLIEVAKKFILEGE